MKTKCLDEFYKYLKNNINQNYSDKIQNLIENENLTQDELSKLIELEASDD